MEKRSVMLAGHATSVALEPAFWQVLDTIADKRGLALAALVAEIDAERNNANLASALRCFALREAVDGNVGNDEADGVKNREGPSASSPD